MANSDCQTCGTCGTGNGNNPLPGDPTNDSILTATPAFGGIDVNWTYPGTNPYAVAHTILFRSTSSNFQNAARRAVVDGSFFYDKVDGGVTYYYWIQFVSINGTYGDPIGPAHAMAKPLIEDMIELLTGQIDSGILATALKNRLDQISILNSNLLSEITDREGGQTTLAQALAQVQDGIAQAHTFITTEINSRTTADSALAEQLNVVASTLGGDYAAVVTSMTTQINALTGTVNAMYTAQVNVNGLVGGFGLANNGTTVEAGFDVDRFWIGRTSADKRKPFIIDSGVVYIDEAAINKLTFSKLRDESGSFIVADGKISAAYLRVTEAAIVDASITTAKIADAQITNAKIGGDIYSSDYVAGTSGWVIGRTGYAEFNNVRVRGDVQASSVQANTITADKVVSDSLSKFYSISSGTVVMPLSQGAQAIRLALTPGADGGGTAIPVYVTLNGTALFTVQGSGYVSKMIYSLAAGTYTLEFWTGNYNSGTHFVDSVVDIEVMIR